MKKWILRIAFALVVVFTAVGYPVKECHAYTFYIRPGASDDDAPGIMLGLEEGWCTPDIAEGIIAAGGFSPDVAAQVQAVIDKVRGGNNIEQQPVVVGQPEKEESKACEHAYEPEIIQKADCCTVGIYEHTCKLCGDTYTEEIPMKEHDYQSHITQEATCHNNGKMRYVCSVCNDSYEEAYDKLEHNAGEWVTTQYATCTETGEETLHCTVCGECLGTRVVEPLGHKNEIWITIKEPTILTQGEQELRCGVCDVIMDSEIIPVNYIGLGVAVAAIFGILSFVTVAIIKRKGKNEK